MDYTFRFLQICIDYPDEYLTSISGTTTCYLVTSLCFHTNQNRYGNSQHGTSFSYEGKGGVLVGFHGRLCPSITSIGFYVMPKSLAIARNSAFEENPRSEVHSNLSNFINSIEKRTTLLSSFNHYKVFIAFNWLNTFIYFFNKDRATVLLGLHCLKL